MPVAVVVLVALVVVPVAVVVPVVALVVVDNKLKRICAFLK